MDLLFEKCRISSSAEVQNLSEQMKNSGGLEPGEIISLDDDEGKYVDFDDKLHDLSRQEYRTRSSETFWEYFENFNKKNFLFL